MRMNTISEFYDFVEDLELLKHSFTRSCLFDMYYKRDSGFWIMDLEKRKVIQSSQTFSLDSEWKSHIEEFILYELYIEYMEQKEVESPNIDTIVLTFRTLDDLKKVEQFVKDNFEFIKK